MVKFAVSLIMLFSVLFQSGPAPVVYAVMFWTPGCSFCEAVLTKVLPPLEAKYGSQLQILKIPLTGVDDVDQLFAAAPTYGVAKEQVAVPFLVVGSQALVGQTAIEEQFPAIIEKGLAQGGIPAPVLPAALAQIAQRPTPTPRPTAEAGAGVVAGPLPAGTDAAAPPLGNCVVGQPTGCSLTGSATAAAPAAFPGPSPLLLIGGGVAILLVLGGGAWALIARRSGGEEEDETEEEEPNREP